MVFPRSTTAAVCLLFAAAFAACDQGRRAPARPLRFDVRAAASAVPLGAELPLRAIATWPAGVQEEVTGRCAWRSAAANVASVADGDGVVHALALGVATVTAHDPVTGMSAALTVTVTAPVVVAVAVTPTNPQIALGTTRQFAAMGTLSDGTVRDLSASAQWSSSTPGTATVDAVGLATSVAPGATTIAAVDPDTSVVGATTLTVTPAVLMSLQVTPTNPSIALGTTRQFAAMGTFSDSTVQDLTTAVQWSSSVPGHAGVDGAGLATGAGVGAATITASHLATGIDAATTLTVTPAVLVSLAVTPGTPSIALGTTQQFAATGTYSDGSTQDLTNAVAWASSAPGTATVDGAGLASSVAVGATTITATDAGSGMSDDAALTVTAAVLTSLAVTPTSPSIALGTTQQFAATGTYSDSSTQDLTAAVTWSSSTPATATVANSGGDEGLATSVAPGTTTVTATDPGTGVSGGTLLTVTPAVLTAIAVTPANAQLLLGGTLQLTATGTYSDSSTQDLTSAVTWASSTPATATVDNSGGNEGLATGVAVGTTTITATHAGSGVVGGTGLTVFDQIALRAAAQAGAASGVLSLTVATPAGTVADDVLLAAIAVRPQTATVTPPGGWTLVRRLDNATGAANSLVVYRRIAVVAEPANHTWTFSTSTGSAGGIAAFAHVDTGTVVDVENGQSTISALTHAAPSLTTTIADTMLVTVHAFSSSATWTPPAGMTEAFDVASEAIGATGISLSTHCELRPATGATGTRTATASNDADTGNTAAIALRRAP